MLYDWIKNIDFAYPENFMLIRADSFFDLVVCQKNITGNRQLLKFLQQVLLRFRLQKIISGILPFILRLLAISCIDHSTGPTTKKK